MPASRITSRGRCFRMSSLIPTQQLPPPPPPPPPPTPMPSTTTPLSADLAMRLRQRKRDLRFLRPDLLNPDIDILDENDETVGFCSRLLYICSLALVLLTLPFSLLFCLRVVAEYERAVLLPRAPRPGLFFTAPCCDTVRIVDLRTVTFDVPPQEVLTKDSVTVAVDAVVYYRIFNPVISVINVAKRRPLDPAAAQTTLRNVLGTKNLSEILAEREDISCLMQESLDAATDPWASKLNEWRSRTSACRAMAAEAEAARERARQGDHGRGERARASRALREAASVIQQSPSALQLRYLHTVSAISAENNSTDPRHFFNYFYAAK
uniref:PHB domain-containing protein n=1 Tax=Macrostomum lignano TaxID=282301 RepID=A0A1I8FJF2_9PLAT